VACCLLWVRLTLALQDVGLLLEESHAERAVEVREVAVFKIIPVGVELMPRSGNR